MTTESLVSDLPLATAGDLALTAAELVGFLHRRRLLSSVALAALAEKAIRSAAEQANLRIPDDELQHAANRFRQRHGLTTASQTHDWLAEEGLSLEEFEDSLEQPLLRNKLLHHLTDDRLTTHFTTYSDSYARTQLSQIVVASEDAARELLCQLHHDGRDFEELARAHSLEPHARATGGSLGIVRRPQLHPAVATAVFAATPGEVVGPVATDRGVHLIRVEAILPAELDDVTASLIRQELFDGWLKEQLQGIEIDLSCLEPA